jgi:signal transduction histidine kinase
MNNILIISRTETGAIKFEPQDVNLNKLCLNLIENIKYLLSDNKSINFNYNVKENIFKLDEVLLKFIIQNLLSNAVKYSFPDTIIDFEVNKQNSSLYIKVSDRGIGIPQEDYSSLFEPFHRGSNVGEIKGTGLGMSIIKRAVEFHKAEISFYSEVNVGTTFLLKIPAEIPQEISE